MIAEAQTVEAVAGRADVLAALKSASQATGSDFGYLLSTAMRESGLDSQAKSVTSSASGLFQFIDQTWLGLIKRYGERHGLGQFASAIEDCGKGRYAVASPADKAAILALRQDPQVSALMAGEAANATRQSLECALGRSICGGELYAAHFLGEGGARHLIDANARQPGAHADSLFPQAAKANRSVFYRADGSPKTVAEVYAWVTKDAPAASVRPAATAQIASIETKDVGTSIGRLQTPPHEDGSRAFERRPKGASEPYRPVPTPELRLPQTPLLLNPGLLEILSALAPSLDRRRA